MWGELTWGVNMGDQMWVWIMGRMDIGRVDLGV